MTWLLVYLLFFQVRQAFLSRPRALLVQVQEMMILEVWKWQDFLQQVLQGPLLLTKSLQPKPVLGMPVLGMPGWPEPDTGLISGPAGRLGLPG